MVIEAGTLRHGEPLHGILGYCGVQHVRIIACRAGGAVVS